METEHVHFPAIGKLYTDLKIFFTSMERVLQFVFLPQVVTFYRNKTCINNLM